MKKILIKSLVFINFLFLKNLWFYFGLLYLVALLEIIING